jgi:tetratricopeptide (TPR) repeat protein
MSKKASISLLLLHLCFIPLKAQLFENEEYKELVAASADYIYNQDKERAYRAIEKTASLLPDHPIVPMMKAVFLLWQEMPMKTTDQSFIKFEATLREVIEKANALDDQYYEEKIFFEMGARALLAEHYADEGSYLKAMGEARRVYGYVKEGFDLVDENPEFLLTTGLYNYFRVAYPDKYPVYKSFVWLFRDGDKALGLKQLHRATKETSISRAEAYLYLSYIYLRYENDKLKAYEVLNELYNAFPNNRYFQVKYVEALLINGYYKKSKPLIDQLLENKKPYYHASALVFQGIYLEEGLGDKISALTSYNLALEKIEELRGHGTHYVSQAYLGAGRIYLEFGNDSRAKEYFQTAIDIAETNWVKDEAQLLLKSL